jgi:hypothetical protein
MDRELEGCSNDEILERWGLLVRGQAALLAAELYAHHSAGLDDDDSAELRDQVADRRLQPGQGLPPLASKPRLGGVLHSLRSLRPCG